MTPQSPLLMHEAFNDLECLAAHAERIFKLPVSPHGSPSLAICARFDDAMATSWEFLEKEDVRHAAMIHALETQVAHNLAQHPSDDPLHSVRARSRPTPPDAIDVEARAVHPDAASNGCWPLRHAPT